MKKNIIILLLFVTVFSLISCDTENEDLFIRHFTIQEGEHYSTPRLVEVLQNDRLSFSVRFDESARYDLGDPYFQSNKNKLLGFADCNSLHHENSARIAWQWTDNRVELFAYCYVNGKRVEEFIGTVKPNEINSFEIRIERNNYAFYMNGEESVKVERGSVCEGGVYYILWPYFGGAVPAPHNVTIDLSINTK